MAGSAEFEALETYVVALLTAVQTASHKPTEVVPQNIRDQWNAVKNHIEKVVLPPLEPAIQLVFRSDLDTIDSHISVVADNRGRDALLPLLVQLVQRLRDRLNTIPAKYLRQEIQVASKEAPNRPDSAAIASALGISDDELSKAEANLFGNHRSIWFTGIGLAVASAALPFAWRPSGSGWALVAEWAVRLAAISALTILAVRVFGYHRGLLDEATRLRRDRHRLAILAAVPHFHSDPESARGLMNIAKDLTASDPTQKDDEMAVLKVPQETLAVVTKLLAAWKGKS